MLITQSVQSALAPQYDFPYFVDYVPHAGYHHDYIYHYGCYCHAVMAAVQMVTVTVTSCDTFKPNILLPSVYQHLCIAHHSDPPSFYHDGYVCICPTQPTGHSFRERSKPGRMLKGRRRIWKTVSSSMRMMPSRLTKASTLCNPLSTLYGPPIGDSSYEELTVPSLSLSQLDNFTSNQLAVSGLLHTYVY